MPAPASERNLSASTRLKFTPVAASIVLVAMLFALVPFTRALSQLYDIWSLQPEYSHGLLIPLISAFLVWRERRWLSETPFEGSWWGPVVVLFGVAMWALGQLSTTLALTHYGFLLVLYGMVLALTGWRVMARLWMPLLVLVFMIPLPAFVTTGLSLRLQLLSSQIGVSLIRLAGISVFVEGNVIDLGVYKLQVAEACDGLRYLFPLMTLGFIVAYFFRGALWKKILIFLASMPIAIVMNVIRIGIIGITVDRWGTSMAEGFLHEFQGWMVFMISTVLLLLVAALLARIGNRKTSWRDTLQLDGGEPLRSGDQTVVRNLPRAFVGAAAIAAVAMLLAIMLPDRVEDIPARPQFVEFPSTMGEWRGTPSAMELVYLDALKLDDYLLTNYYRTTSPAPVNLYVAWYNSQRSGASVHSPRSCLPGGGWTINSLDTRVIPDLVVAGKPLQVNRVLIELGTQRQLVYYWFQQRGHVINNEYLVKWYIFVDSLRRNRTDGSLVRLTMPLGQHVTEAEADAELQRFARTAMPALHRYIPD
jgi:exosortase D (VPLPA-CTERM-specific)